MNRNILSVFVIGILVLAGASLAAGQTLTDEQRLERCRTNADYLASSQNEHNNIEAILRGRFDQEAPIYYGELNSALQNKRIVPLFESVSGRKTAAENYALPWNTVWETDKLAFQRALRTKIASLLQFKKGSSENDLVARYNELDQQIKFHQARQKELRCDEKAAAKPDAAKVDLSGQWSDNWGYTIVLKDSGGSITGTFTKGGNVGTFTGSYDSQTGQVTLRYEEPWKKSHGKVILTLAANGRSMSGPYVSIVPGYSAPQEGSWTMSR